MSAKTTRSYFFVVVRRKCRASSVIDRHARIRVRMVRVILAAEPDDDRIDLDRVDMLRAVPERRRHVGPRSRRPSTSTFSKRVAEHHVGPLVEVFLLLDRRHRLVKDVVDLDDRVGAVLTDGDLVVRGPQRSARHDVHEDERQRQQRDVDGDERAACATAPASTRLAGSAAAAPPRRSQCRTTTSARAAATR